MYFDEISNPINKNEQAASFDSDPEEATVTIFNSIIEHIEKLLIASDDFDKLNKNIQEINNGDYNAGDIIYVNLNENTSNADDVPESSKNKKYSVTISDIIKKLMLPEIKHLMYEFITISVFYKLKLIYLKMK